MSAENRWNVESEEFIKLFGDLSDAIVSYRTNNGGKIPKELWLKSLELAGSYPCVEIIPIDYNTTLPLLKIRHDPNASGGELDWEGKLHIPGNADLPMVRAEELLPRLLTSEIIKDEKDINTLLENISFLTFVKYPEIERKTVANTLVFTLPVNPQILQDDFVLIDNEEKLNRVISQHRFIIDSLVSYKIKNTSLVNGNFPVVSLLTSSPNPPLLDTRK